MMLPMLVKVFPHEFKRVMGVSRAAEVAAKPVVPAEQGAKQVVHG
jgi:hypothetical protein